MNLKLLFKKAENEKEFVEKSKLSKIVNIVTIVSFILWGFFKLFSDTPFARLIIQTPLNPNSTPENYITIIGLFNYLFLIISISLLVFKFILTKSLNLDYNKYRKDIENNEQLFKEYEPFYFKRVKTYIDVNGAFSLNKNKTKVKVGYQRNTCFALIILVVFVVGYMISYVYTNPKLYMRLFHQELQYNIMSDLWSIIGAVCGLAIILYVYYVVNRFKNYKENYINVTADELKNDNYNHKWDENYLDYMQNSEILSKRATNYFNAHNKGWLRGLFCTKEDALLFGIEIFCAFIYLAAIYFVFMIIVRICISCSPELEAKYNNHIAKKEAKSVARKSAETQKRLVLTGRSFNEYYEMDGKYIREGLGTPYGNYTGYEIHGNEICYQKDGQWKTMAVISKDGSNGSVMYLNDYSGEKVFERYEWK